MQVVVQQTIKAVYPKYYPAEVVDFFCELHSKEASLPAALLYEKLGFVTIKHEQYCMKNGAVLVYEIMEKEFS